MMKERNIFKGLALFAVMLFACTCVQAQDLNRTDSRGMKQGLWKNYYPNRVLKSEGSYKNDKPQGLFRLYFPTGVLKAEMDYKDDLKSCAAVLYDSTGRKMAEGLYINRKKEGGWKFYSEETGTLRAEETYKDDILNGPYRVFYRDSVNSARVMEEGAYLNGKKKDR